MSQDYYTADSGTENRNDLLQVASLWEYLCERAAADAKIWYKDKTTPPPLTLIIGCAVATILFIAMGSQIAFIFGALTFAQVFWLIMVKSANSARSLASALEKIESGSFPPELTEVIAKRLRWWNFLIVPQDWTHNSRIYELQDRFRVRIEQLMSKREYWISPEGMDIRKQQEKETRDADLRREEQNKKLKLLQSRGVNVTGFDEVTPHPDNKTTETFSDPELLCRLIKSPAQRDEHMRRINRTSDPLSKINEELIFTQAMLIKSEKITTLLDQIENLMPPLQKLTPSGLDLAVREVVNVLEQRRKLVIQINQIPPKLVMQLLNYDLTFTERDLENEQ